MLAIRAQEEAGLDIVTDGEIRRESYSNRFATALDGVDIDNPGTALDRSGHPNPVPRVTGPIRRRHPVEVEDLKFLRANTNRTVKITVPGPFTMAQQAQDDYYGSTESLALGYAEAVGEEVQDLFAAGADIVQLDEPYLQARSEQAHRYGVKAVNRALEGAAGTTAVHLCFGYAAIIHDRPAGYSFLPELADCSCDQISIETAQSGLDCSVLAALDGKTIILGVLDLNDLTVESPETVTGPGPAGTAVRAARPPGARPGLRHEIPATRRRLRQTDRADGSRRPAARRVRLLARRRHAPASFAAYAAPHGRMSPGLDLGCGPPSLDRDQARFD